MKKVILDTNILLVPGQWKVDIFESLNTLDFSVQLFVLDKSMTELESISASAKKASDKLAARMAGQLIDKKKVKIIKTKEGKTDDILVEFAEVGYLIATQDQELIKRIKDSDGHALQLRQRKYFIVR